MSEMFDIDIPTSYTHEDLVLWRMKYKIAVIYARYSCDRQNEQSIDGQVRVCKEYAEKNGIKIVAIYYDKAMSGTNDNRDDFQRMLKDSDKQEWDYVLIYKLDRFSRNKYEMAIHRKRLKDNGIKILSAMENIPDSPEGILLESLLEGMNQYYSEELSQKTKRGMNETRLKGNFIGGTINYGWSLIDVIDKETNKKIAAKVIINEDEAPIVREIFEEYANGKNPIDIARSLNERGILNRGKRFQTQMIYYILRHEKYTGIYRINDCAYDKIYPPLVPMETYQIVRARIDANKYGKHIVHDESYLLKGKIYCGFCGRRMTSFTGTSKSGKMSRYYKCHKTEPCEQSRTVKKDVLEAAILEALNKVLMNEENYNLLVDAVLKAHNDKIKDNSSLRFAEKELQKTETALSNLIAAVEAGFFSETSKTRLIELEERKKELKLSIATEKSKEVPRITREQVENYLTFAIEQSPQTWIDLLVKRVAIKDDIIELLLEYTHNINPTPPKNGRRNKAENPERILSERGSFFMEFTFSYRLSKTGRPPLGRPNKYYKPKNKTRIVTTRIFV